MSSKKALLSKLKKNVESKRRATESLLTSSSPVLDDRLNVHSTTSSVEQQDIRISTIQQRHHEFVLNLEILVNEMPFPRPQIIDQVRVHISFYPDDHLFHHLLELDDTMLKEFVLKSVYSGNISQFLKDFMHSIYETQKGNAYEWFQTQLKSLPDNEKTFAKLLSIDPYIFASLEFQPTYQTHLVPPLIQTILSLSISTPAEIRKTVDQFMYNHRFDYIMTFLQNPEISEQDKNEFTRQTMEDLYENIRSKQMYFQIMELIDEKQSNFHKPLQSILYKNVPDKKMIPPLKHYFDLILDVVINNPSDKSLEKYFPSKARFEDFKKNMYPLLQTERGYTYLIRSRCTDTFDQPFLFKNANRIRFDSYIDSIKKHLQNPMISIGLDLYDKLHKNQNDKLAQIFVLLNQPTTQRTQLDIVLQQYISTQPYKNQQDLRKLLKMSVPKIKDVLQNYQVQEYVDILKNISLEDPRPDILITQPSKINYIEMTNDTQEIIERTRPFIPNFDHIAIAPIDNVSMYILRPDGNSTTYYIPNATFFEDLVKSSIPKSQNGNVFTLNGRKMTIANVSVYQEYIVQNESMFAAGQKFIQAQQRLESVTTPITFFTQFCAMPVLNHQSQFMKQFRQKNRAMLSSSISKNGVDVRSNQIAQEVEQSIFESSSNLREYSDRLSIITPLIYTSTSSLSTYASHFRKLLHTNGFKWSHIGEVLAMNMDVIIEAFFPEALFDESGILRPMFEQDIAMAKRRILLDAYTSQFPMRRIPYLPVNPSLRSFRTDKIFINQETLSRYTVSTELTDYFVVEPSQIQPSALTELERRVDIEAVEETTTPRNYVDPLEFFIETAFEELYNL